MPDCKPLEYKKLLLRHSDPKSARRKWEVHEYTQILGTKDSYNSAVKLIDDSEYATTEVDDERLHGEETLNQRPMRKTSKSSKYRDFITDEKNLESSGSEAVQKKKPRRAILESSDSNNDSKDEDLGADDLDEIPQDESIPQLSFTTRSTKTVKITHQILKTPTKVLIPKVSSHLQNTDQTKISNDLEYIKGMLSAHYELSVKTQESLVELSKTEDRTLYKNLVFHLSEFVVDGSLTNAVNTVLRTVMTDAVGRLFNMSGTEKDNKQKKVAFGRTSVAELALDALVASGAKTDPTISRGNVISKMKRWLQDAPTRYNRKVKTMKAKKSDCTDGSGEDISLKSNDLASNNDCQSSDGELEKLTTRNEKRGSTKSLTSKRLPIQTMRQTSSTSFASSGSDDEIDKRRKVKEKMTAMLFLFTENSWDSHY
ncbi:Hypothetical predicted protein [Cloeon dipterum]|uniref:DUF4806 domain-containing protein n=1 Tax=Cloeon dipterum TaxID=197152 RepID=A0A8S1CUU0_9INSE|nr:Hypothetical predicted protein [Cloeon dipterum]